MGKFLATVFPLVFFIGGGLPLGALDRVTLPIPSSPEVTVTPDALVWAYPQASGAPGTVDWAGTAPTNLRDPRVVSLDGSPALAVVATRNGREGLYVLSPIWAGAELAGAAVWLEAPAGETIVGYRWLSGSPATVILWTAQTALGRIDHPSWGILRGQTALTPASQRVVTLLSWTEEGPPRWALVDLAETTAGWVPSIHTFTEGRWDTRAAGQPVPLSGTSLVELAVTHPVDGQFAVSAVRGASWAQWAWNTSGPRPPLILTLDSPPRDTAAPLPDRPAFFWWVDAGRAAGLVTERLGTSQPVAWSQALPGTLVWSSGLLVRSGGWRTWLIVETAESTELYRLDVRGDGWSSLDRAGALPRGATSLTLKLDDGQWSVLFDSPSEPLFLDPEIPRLSEMRNPL